MCDTSSWNLLSAARWCRLSATCLVSRRWHTLSHTPALLHTIEARRVVGLESTRSLHSWLQRHAGHVQQLLLRVEYKEGAAEDIKKEQQQELSKCFSQLTAAGCLTHARLDWSSFSSNTTARLTVRLPASLRRLHILLPRFSFDFEYLRPLVALESLTLEDCNTAADFTPVRLLLSLPLQPLTHRHCHTAAAVAALRRGRRGHGA